MVTRKNSINLMDRINLMFSFALTHLIGFNYSYKCNKKGLQRTTNKSQIFIPEGYKCVFLSPVTYQRYELGSFGFFTIIFIISHSISPIQSFICLGPTKIRNRTRMITLSFELEKKKKKYEKCNKT